MSIGLPPISYPALFWHEGYILLAEKPLNLCATDRSYFAESLQRARSGKEHLLDAEGRYFDVVDWVRIPTVGGLTGYALRLIGTIYAAPVLGNERQLSLDEFKKTVAQAIRGRYRYDDDKYHGLREIQELKGADSYRAVLEAVPWGPSS